MAGFQRGSEKAPHDRQSVESSGAWFFQRPQRGRLTDPMVDHPTVDHLMVDHPTADHWGAHPVADHLAGDHRSEGEARQAEDHLEEVRPAEGP